MITKKEWVTLIQLFVYEINIFDKIIVLIFKHYMPRKMLFLLWPSNNSACKLLYLLIWNVRHGGKYK